jgi:N-acetylglucosamine-6-sulfatase
MTPAPEYIGDPRCASATNTDAPAFNEADVSDKPHYIRIRGMQNAVQYGSTVPRKQCETLLSVDDMVGTILQALRDTGRLGTTFILYTSDNGLSNGEHRWTQKRVPYEASVKVPFVIRFDPLTAGEARSATAPVANIDVAPTVTDLAGASVLPGCPSPWYAGVCTQAFDGASMLPLLSDPSAPWREAVLLEHYGESGKTPVPTYCGLRTTRHKYVRYATGEEELYDLVPDPHEMVNLLGDGDVTIDEMALRDVMRERLFGPSGSCNPAPPGYQPP